MILSIDQHGVRMAYAELGYSVIDRAALLGYPARGTSPRDKISPNAASKADTSGTVSGRERARGKVAVLAARVNISH